MCYLHFPNVQMPKIANLRLEESICVVSFNIIMNYWPIATF